MEKEKIKKYFHNFFLMSVLFHLVLLALLNVQRVQKIYFINGNLKELLPPFDYFVVPREEAAPKQNETKINTQINPDIGIGKVIKKTGQVNIIEKMSIVEIEFPEEQIKNKLFDFKTNIEKKEFVDERMDKADVSITFEKTGLINNTENNKAWTNSKDVNIKEEFNRKIVPRDYRGKGLSLNKPINIGVFGKSDKIIITAVRVWMDSAGKVIKAEIYKSSGYIELDQLALNNIRRKIFIPNKNEPIRIAIIEIDFTHIR